MTHIGIIEETKNAWEARCPLTPEQMSGLREECGAQFTVSPSSIRIFADDEFLSRDISMKSDLSDCDIIMGIKEIPPQRLVENRIHVFFSHTIKGQAYNMPLLRRILELNITLLDYERIVDEQGRRLVFFGTFAGIAGIINALWAYGQRLKAEGHQTPFEHIKRPLEYGSTAAAKEHFQSMRADLETYLTDHPPLIIAVTGTGNVSKGVQDVLDALPLKTIKPQEIPAVAAGTSEGVVYKAVFSEEDMMTPKDPQKEFDLQEYYTKPDLYESVFHTYLPYLSVIANCIYWTDAYDRLVKQTQIKELYKNSQYPLLQVIADISCDIEGSIECNLKAANNAEPVYVYDTDTGQAIEGVEGHGPVLMTVDNLPAELPREASEQFGSTLYPLVKELAAADFSNPYQSLELSVPLKNAVIAHQGSLAPDYEYLYKALDENTVKKA